jgi:protein O-GlcNAcase/histone acetyltransferase
MATQNMDFLAGVIEGFYGPPWSQAERFELFDWMSSWGLNTYLYAPKDDLKHRALWRDLYSGKEAEVLAEVSRACTKRSIRFIYGLAPGLDIRYHDVSEIASLQARFKQMMGIGCRDFALLFDDIPDRMNPEDSRRWNSFASAQCHVANTMFRWTQEQCPGARFLFCPTPYCGRMRERGFGGSDYLPTLGRELLREIDVFWTGPEIISREITLPHIRELQEVLRRKPLIWDNLHANDYDGRRFYCGPYSGRPLELRHEVTGLLVNPNTEFYLNYVPFRTLAEFAHCPAGSAWNPRQAYLSAMQEWLPRFATVGQPVDLKDLVLLGDCYYLPYEQGPEADALYSQVRAAIAVEPGHRGAQIAGVRESLTRLRTFCSRMAELEHRPLFYALSRRVWELREELDLLDRYFEFISSGRPAASFTSDFHLPGTYRGGMVARLQTLLRQHADGTLTP